MNPQTIDPNTGESVTDLLGENISCSPCENLDNRYANTVISRARQNAFGCSTLQPPHGLNSLAQIII
jgi:hypothetical protein